MQVNRPIQMHVTQVLCITSMLGQTIYTFTCWLCYVLFMYMCVSLLMRGYLSVLCRVYLSHHISINKGCIYLSNFFVQLFTVSLTMLVPTMLMLILVLIFASEYLGNYMLHKDMTNLVVSQR